MTAPRDHGGGIDAARARYGGARADWLDLSTGINPVPYPVATLGGDAWTALPDAGAQDALIRAARRFWSIPDAATVIAAPGASALIARLPALHAGPAHIPQPTYNEHRAAYAALGRGGDGKPDAPVRVLVHPNNPDGRLWPNLDLGTRPLTVVDESFCDVTPEQSHTAKAGQKGLVILKSFGKFWGLAGVRLGFAVGDDRLARMADLLGPWPVSGPALAVGTAALNDPGWASDTRARLARDAARLDALMVKRGAQVVGGTTLFRLYQVEAATHWQHRLARGHVWSRVFPYAHNWLRLGLPAPDRWAQLEAAL
jgi:cobalamin biosynthesis protein CobC